MTSDSVYMHVRMFFDGNIQELNGRLKRHGIPAVISSKNNRFNVYIRKSIGAKRERDREEYALSGRSFAYTDKKKVLFQYSFDCMFDQCASK